MKENVDVFSPITSVGYSFANIAVGAQRPANSDAEMRHLPDLFIIITTSAISVSCRLVI